ncbi:hypothetical protein BGZ73_008488 [Actinomortierella ambigua]|nr:hypothetical protein BGZ73_008488 [Actinomortierella ambigua]
MPPRYSMSSSESNSWSRANDGFVVIVQENHSGDNDHDPSSGEKVIQPSRGSHCNCNCRCHSTFHYQERHIATPTNFALGLDCDRWIEDFEEIARANNWPRPSWLDILPIYMKGQSTKAWFRENRVAWQLSRPPQQEQQQHRQQLLDEYDAFKQAFLLRFARDASGELVNTELREESLRDLRVLKQGMQVLGAIILFFIIISFF